MGRVQWVECSPWPSPTQVYLTCPHVYYVCWQVRGQGIASAVLKDLARSASEDQRSACLSEPWTVTDPAYSVDAGDRTQALTLLPPPVFPAIFSERPRIQESRMNLLLLCAAVHRQEALSKS